jgi:hypothetical protein
MVTPNSFVFFLPLMLGYALLCAGIGLLSGWSVAAIFKSRNRNLVLDATLGLVGLLLAAVLVANIPWPQRTVITEGNRTTILTTDRYQRPQLVAFLLAAILPSINELYRFRWYGQRTTSGDS